MKLKQSRKRRGFTLIELMIVVGIIIILASLGIPSYYNYKENARRAKCVSNLRVILEAKMAWRVNNPTASTATDLAGLGKGSYFRGATDAVPTCPSGGTYQLNWDTVDIPEKKPTCNFGNGHELKLTIATQNEAES